jgi:hypothetical protein
MSSKSSIIFLDIGGVLQYSTWSGDPDLRSAKLGNSTLHFVAEAIEALNSIDATSIDLGIVLTSDYRLHNRFLDLRSMFNSMGLRIPLIDTTNDGSPRGTGRVWEIHDWLLANDDVSSFAIVDDDVVFSNSHLVKHFVHTPNGLCSAHTAKLEVILKDKQLISAYRNLVKEGFPKINSPSDLGKQ